MPNTVLSQARTTPGTGHPRLHPLHAGHLYAGEVVAQPLRLRSARTVVGSSASCDIEVTTLEARHFEILREEDDRYVVRPLQGRVEVDGRGGSAVVLHTGAVVRCGDWAASFARDASTDQVRERAERYLNPRGFFGHLEHLAFLLYGTSTPAPRRRHDPQDRG